ncbi:serine/threonine protein kinase [Capronia epimyces CBS 606.96]|uniref:EKC/KEOPS complex subunit BUD32 n=1 Tax=Capronia epimyces CBS 606.96 TaxID=1182542 RepID=W9XQ20_9EURO|nr:serine/threonine protein kinase [Capronia epimyces CBS 606.96]EXJ82318.1 serine/threonine protein kinase [Capronia epimyces CBS 606.96]
MRVIAVKEYIGSISAFFAVEGGMILKSIHPVLAETEGYKLMVEQKILQSLGEHPRIVKYRGYHDDSELKGLLFLEASHGNLQNYLDQNNKNNQIDDSTRQKWCQQATEAVQFIHSKGVIHSDLRPENYLVHGSAGSLDLQLCDFGGSMCRDLGVDGRGLPDPPFWDLSWESTVGTDIFSLGSIFYTIMTGVWPYKTSHRTKEKEEEEAKEQEEEEAKEQEEEEREEEDKWQFEDRVIALLGKGIYPDVKGIIGGTIMMQCWKKQYLKADEVLEAQMKLSQGCTD